MQNTPKIDSFSNWTLHIILLSAYNIITLKRLQKYDTED